MAHTVSSSRDPTSDTETCEDRKEGSAVTDHLLQPVNRLSVVILT